MLKVLEKSPFIRWKFVQRLMHRQRMNKRSGSGKFKTFSSNSGASGSDDTHQILSDDHQDDPISNTTKDSPFNTKRNIQKVNERDGFGPTQDSQTMSVSVSEPEGMTTVTLEASPRMGRRCYSDDDIANLKYDDDNSENDEIDTTDKDVDSSQSPPTAEPITLVEEQSRSRTQYNPIAFQRSSGLRRSFKEWKRRSLSRLDTVKQNMRRKVSTSKYDDLDTTEDELIKYEVSPGVKRRQERTDQFRRSMRRSGRFALAAMQQLPGVGVVQAMSSPPGAFMRG